MTAFTPYAYAEDETEQPPTPIPTYNPNNFQAKTAYLLNATTGEVLYANNEHEPMTPASLTKIMTLLVTEDKLASGDIKLSDKVEISKKSWLTGGSKMFLEVGMHYTVEELIKGVAIVSGNDAAVSLAEHISGDTDAFVDEMNKEAKKIGMDETTFQTVNGLPLNGKKDVTTAHDLAILADYYIKKYPEMLKIHSTKTYTTILKHKKTIEQPNNNSLLGTYEGMDGLKTGFANYYNFIGTAERGGNRLIVVTLGSSSSSKRMSTAETLLDFGFANYKTYNSETGGTILQKLPVYKATNAKESEVALKSDVTYTINIRDEKKVKIEDRMPNYILGGTKKGDKIGEEVVLLDGKVIAKSNIVTTEDLHRTTWFVSIFHQLALTFTQLVEKVTD